MSRLYYFASDAPLDARPNPHLEMLSVNEALARGIALDLSLFPDSFDYDCPDVILYTGSEDAFEHPNIFLIDPSDFCEDIGTARRYCTELEWDWYTRTAHEVLAYITEQIARVGTLELWSIWLGDRNIPETVKRTELHLAALTADVLRAFLNDADNGCLTIIN